MNEPIIFTTGRWHGKSAHVRREALAAADRGERVFHATFEPWEDFSRSLAAAIGAPIDDQYSVEPIAGGYVITRRETKEAAMEQSKRVVPMVGDVWHESGIEREIAGIAQDGAIHLTNGATVPRADWDTYARHGFIGFIRRRNAPDPRIAELEAEIAVLRWMDTPGGLLRDVVIEPLMLDDAMNSAASRVDALGGLRFARVALQQAQSELAALRGTARNAETIPAPASEATIEGRFPIGSRWRLRPDTDSTRRPGTEVAVAGHVGSYVVTRDDRGMEMHARSTWMAECYDRIDKPTDRIVGKQVAFVVDDPHTALPTCDFTGPTIPPHALELTDHGTCRTCASSASDRLRARRAKFDAGVRTSLVTVEIDASKPFVNGRGEKLPAHLHPERHRSVHVATFGGKAGPQMPTAAMATEALWTMLERGAR